MLFLKIYTRKYIFPLSYLKNLSHSVHVFRNIFIILIVCNMTFTQLICWDATIVFEISERH